MPGAASAGKPGSERSRGKRGDGATDSRAERAPSSEERSGPASRAAATGAGSGAKADGRRPNAEAPPREKGRDERGTAGPASPARAVRRNRAATAAMTTDDARNSRARDDPTGGARKHRADEAEARAKRGAGRAAGGAEETYFDERTPPRSRQEGNRGDEVWAAARSSARKGYRRPQGFGVRDRLGAESREAKRKDRQICRSARRSGRWVCEPKAQGPARRRCVGSARRRARVRESVGECPKGSVCSCSNVPIQCGCWCDAPYFHNIYYQKPENLLHRLARLCRMM